MRINQPISATIFLLGAVMSQSLFAGETKKGYSPHATKAGEKQVLWGDTHLHTTLSLDARAFGVELDQETAYRFARGEQVTSTHGLQVKLERPLDFLVVSDHSDAMGTMSEIISGNKDFMKNEKVASWNKRLNDPENAEILATRMEVMTSLTDGSAPDLLLDRDFFKNTWENYLVTADQFNEPGRFTAMIGYEWTSSEGGSNLHRNVLYRDGATQARTALPYTSTESGNPEDLWKWLEAYEDKSGGKILALAHNGNLSNGLMFPEINPETGEPLTGDYAKTRARWEPLYEVTQIKGDGETHPLISVNDEFADYETWDRGNFAGVPKTEEMLPFEYARSALTRGLELESKLGTNPYKFGMIGSTDSHTGLATGDEDNFFGKMSYMEPSKERWNSVLGKVAETVTMGWQMTASGYAAVWATENTRAAIFDAMMRRETYATTGPRIILKFNADYANQSVPMGGELMSAEGASASPVFAFDAWKDPLGANLDRLQIVKGSLDKEGQTHEKVFDVAWSGDREINSAGKLSAVRNTVDIETASYKNSIGSSHLRVEWQDPNFNPGEAAYYYARVLEIPTPRWTSYDAVAFETKVDNPEVPMITQERAYSSPIWFSPENK
jgi:hypothetical protein